MLDEYYLPRREPISYASDALRTIEKLRYQGSPALGYSLTIDDPKIFTAPWTQEFQIVVRPEWDAIGLYEYVCDNLRCPGGKCEADSE
jgi:hypothetical protein